MKKGVACIYCGSPATTEDHLPPRNIFPKNLRNWLVKVPSCLECNRGASADDEFFRMFVAGFSSEHSSHAKSIFEGPIKRAASQRPALAHAFLGKMRPILAKSQSGIITGKAIGVKFTGSDWERFYSVIARTARGLYYSKYGLAIPDSYEVRVMFCDDERIKQIAPVVRTLEPENEASVIFRYAYGKAADGPSSVWVMNFYEKITFAAWIAPVGTFKSRRKSGNWVVDFR